jgi:transposase-like protein
MVLIPVLCPHCQSHQVIKGGTTKAGKQRYRCHNADCPHYSFVRHPAYQGHVPEIKAQIIEMALNGSGIRDTARVLKISPTTVVSELKKTTVVKLPPEAPQAVPTKPETPPNHGERASTYSSCPFGAAD